MMGPRRFPRASFALSLALLLGALGLAPGTDARTRRRARPSAARDFDRRAEMRWSGRPSSDQLEAVASLRDALSGSLLDTYDPASGVTHSLLNPVGKLTPPRSGAPLDVSLAFIRENVVLLGLELGDLEEMAVCDVVRSVLSGATHVYFCQRHLGLDVYNAQLQVNVSADGSILSVNNSFAPGTKRRPRAPRSGIDGADACVAVGRHLGVSAAVRRRGRALVADTLSSEPIEPKLLWVPVGRELRLAWRLELHTPDGRHVYDVTVDAEPGADPRAEERVLTRFDRVSPGLYQVYPLPTESPNHAAVPPPDDGRGVVSSPEHPLASPLGWHDDGTTAYQIMRGNNVHAYDDLNADDLPPAIQPDCGPGLECSFPLDLTQDPTSYTSAAVANLFYWTNVMHDVQYLYGFDETAGNFQANNFGRGGLGGDAVRAEAQDGSGIDNANFTTYPDGQAPKIQMFLWDFTFPLRDGDLDAGVILHEYGHGISTRLVGGPSTVSCLSNPQQPGEGLSDWWALVYTAKPGDRGSDLRGIGSYVVGEPTSGVGIRTQPYTTNPTLNTHTYESIFGMAVPHGVGEVWAEAAWKVYWTLVAFHGFDPDLYDPMGGAGNQRMMLYVNEGLKNTACSPTFTDVRDGILQAAVDHYGGEDVCHLWEAFAAFGLGEDAVSGGPFSTFAVNGFQVPASCLAGPRLTSPAPYAQFPGSTVTFQWTADGEDVSEWVLEVGTRLGEADAATTGSLPGTSLSATLTGLPVDGRQLYVRLNYLIGSEWSFRDALYTADLATPELVGPLPGTVLAGPSATFSWDSFGLPVEGWTLDVGSTPGQGDFFSSGTLAGDVLSIEVTGIPTDGRPVYARLSYLFAGDWHRIDASYTAASILPVLTSPAPGSTLSGSDVTFEWDANGGLVDDWMLLIGSSFGLSELLNTGSLGPGATSWTVTGLPTNGSTLYVRLRYAYRGVWHFIDHAFTAADLTPEMVSPVPGSVFTSSSVTFTWLANEAPVTSWVLEVGSSPGSSSYFYSGNLAAGTLSVTATGLPTDSRTIYVRLRYLASGTWVALHYVYTAADLVPELTSPAPGSVLPGSSASFAWTSNGAPVTSWTLGVGTQPGLSNLFYSGNLGAGVLSATATQLPTDSRTLYVSLRYLINGSWATRSYAYTAADLVPELTSPAPGSVLPGEDVTFSWSSNGAPVTSWTLGVGTQPGLSNLFYSNTLAASVSSALVVGLPLDSSTLYVRLRYLVGGVWTPLDYVLIAGAPPPVVTDPLPGSQLADTAQSFSWSDNGSVVTEWRLTLGSALGDADLFDSGLLDATARSATASGLPTDGRELYLRLYYEISGVVSASDFLYRATLREPDMTSPIPGSELSGPQATFVWSANGVAVSEWRLSVGGAAGSSDLYDSGPLPPETLAQTVSGLPTDGRELHVRLSYLAGAASVDKDYLYIAGVGVPDLLLPVPDSTLSGSDVTFEWTSNSAPVTRWLLYVGTSFGSSNVFYSGYLDAGVTSASVTRLPTDRRTLYVRLRYLLNGLWQFHDYQYTAANLVPSLVSPEAGAVLESSNVTFTWSANGASVTSWRLYVGPSRGSSSYFYSGNIDGSVLSADVFGLPTDSRTLFVRLSYLSNAVWSYVDYELTAANLVPELTSPAPGTVLPGSTATFDWTSNGAPVTRWILDVGTSPGLSNLYYSGALTSDVTSATVTGLPTNGLPLYVRLRYVLGGTWKSASYVYTASTLP